MPISHKIRNFAVVMQFPIQLDILDFVFHGILIGIMASAPMGPVGVLCIQRTLNKGRWYGFVTGIGACVSDFIYALFTGVGMSFVMDFVSNERTRFLLQISGSIVLLIFGIYCYRSNPTKNIHTFLLLLGYGLYFICQIALQHMQFPFWFIMDYYQLLIFCRKSWMFGILRVQQKCSE